jgi:hypothetical protein
MPPNPPKMDAGSFSAVIDNQGAGSPLTNAVLAAS